MRADQDVKPGRVAKLGPGHVDHQRPAPGPGRFEQRRPQPGGIGDIDLLGRRHDARTAEHLNGEAGHRHLYHLPMAVTAASLSRSGHYQDRDRTKACQ